MVISARQQQPDRASASRLSGAFGILPDSADVHPPANRLSCLVTCSGEFIFTLRSCVFGMSGSYLIDLYVLMIYGYSLCQNFFPIFFLLGIT